MRDCGLLDAINDTLVKASRLVVGREAEPTAAIIDSQSVKTTESGGISSFDASYRHCFAIACWTMGKKVKGRKRHIMTDTQGNRLHCEIHAGDIQDRDGAFAVINVTCQTWLAIRYLFADCGYSGWNLQLGLL